MINLATEHLLRLADVPNYLPRNRKGLRLNVAAIHRWTSHGKNGVRLETLSLPTGKVTSLEALQRFAEKLTSTTKPRKVTTSRRHSCDIERAHQAVHSILASSRKPNKPSCQSPDRPARISAARQTAMASLAETQPFDVKVTGEPDDAR